MMHGLKIYRIGYFNRDPYIFTTTIISNISSVFF